MHIRMVKDDKGAKAGDVIRFEDRDEALALVAAGGGEEVKQGQDGQWVVVNRVTAEVTDNVTAR